MPNPDPYAARIETWRAGFRQCTQSEPPSMIPLASWRLFLRDASGFLAGSWARTALTLGWDDLQLFGADRDRPWQRLDHQGALWFLHGNKIHQISERVIVMGRAEAKLRYVATSVDPDHVVMPWELV